MFFRQYHLECLAQLSYLVGDRTSGRAVVVDPQRDVTQYLTDAEAELPIEHLHDGQRLVPGEVALEALATPGHTPEAISLVVWEHAGDPVPWGVLTGDMLFIGDVGRPDLLASAGWAPDDLARRLYRSLHGKLLSLPDATRAFPGHGEGSACGKQLSSATSSNIGEQRSGNHAARHAGDVARAGEVAIIDGRSPSAFASGHLQGSINVDLDGRFAEHAGAVVRPHQAIVLVTGRGRETEAKVRLARVGLDRVLGHVPEIEGLLARRPELARVAQRVTTGELEHRRVSDPSLQIVDVRTAMERDAGMIAGACSAPLASLLDRLHELERTRPVIVYCARGNRSSVAASLLRARGFFEVADLLGGVEAWIDRGLPLVAHDSSETGR